MDTLGNVLILLAGVVSAGMGYALMVAAWTYPLYVENPEYDNWRGWVAQNCWVALFTAFAGIGTVGVCLTIKKLLGF